MEDSAARTPLDRRDGLLALAWGLGALAYYLPLKLQQWRAFTVHAELADFEAILWNTVHGHPLREGGAGLSFLHQHVSPILLALAPVYAAAPHPVTLLVAQAVLAAAAAAPLYLLAVDRLADRRAAHLATLAYVVARQTNYGLTYDFHMEVFYPVLYFGLFLAMVRARWTVFAVLLLLTMAVKEDAMAVNLGLGLWLATGGCPRQGLATAAVSLAGLALAFGVIMPAFTPDGAPYRFLSYWSDYGTTPGGILTGMLDPVRQAHVLLDGAKLGKMFNLFGAVLLLPLLHWRTVLCLVAPAWYMLYSTNQPVVWGVSIYYGFLIMPLLWLAALENLRRLGRRGLRATRAVLVLTALLALVNLANSRLFIQLQPGYWRPDPRWHTADALLAAIPPGAPVAAQVDLVSHLPVRQARWCLPWGVAEAQWVLFDLEGNAWPLDPAENRVRARDLAASAEWTVRAERDGFLLLERTAAAAPAVP